MRRPPLALLLPLGLAACAPLPSDRELAAGLERTQCGLGPAIRIPRPGTGASRAASGDAIRACDLPTAENIRNACRVAEAVKRPGSESVTPPHYAQFDFPDYRVRAAACTFASADRKTAACTYELAGPGEPLRWRKARSDLVYRFHDLSNEVEHDFYMATWEVERPCAPG